MTATECAREARRLAKEKGITLRAKATGDKAHSEPFVWPPVDRMLALEFTAPTFECCLAAFREWLRGQVRS